MNLLDRAIAWVSPGAAYRRSVQREMLEAHHRGYAAGRMDRQSAGWLGSGASPDEALRSGAGLLVRRSRDLGRNNPWISSALRRIPASIVGTGVTASVQIDAPRVRKSVQEDWDYLREEGNAIGRGSWDADLAVLIRTVCEVGDALIVWEYVRSDEGLRVPLRWAMYPPEYLDRTRMTGALDGNAISQGVETNRQGRVVAYWLYDRHPQDTLHGVRPESRRVDASLVDLVFEPLWLHQRRGVPWLAPVALSADELQQYDTAALWKARMAASYGLVRERTPTSTSALGQEKPDVRGRRSMTLAPGMVLEPEPGDKVTQLNPPRDENFQTFWTTRLYAIAAGLGLPYASLTGDLRGVNYSGLREGKLLWWELVDQWQWNMVHDAVLRHAWRRFGEARYAAGRTQGGVRPPVKWGFPKRPWVDPLKDIAALEREMDLGLVTWPDAVAARGEDPQQQIAEVETWNGRLTAAGLPVGRGNTSREAAEASRQAIQPGAEGEDGATGAQQQ